MKTENTTPVQPTATKIVIRRLDKKETTSDSGGGSAE